MPSRDPHARGRRPLALLAVLQAQHVPLSRSSCSQRSPTALPKRLFILFHSLTLPFGKLQATGIFPSGVPDSCDEHGKARKFSQALESKDSLGKDLFSVQRINNRLSTCRNQDCCPCGCFVQSKRTSETIVVVFSLAPARHSPQNLELYLLAAAGRYT